MLDPQTRGRTLPLADRPSPPADPIPVPDELDPVAVLELRGRIIAAWEAGHRRVAVDLSRVQGPDTRTLSLLCAALRRLTDRGPTIVVAAAPRRVRRILELCAIDGLEFHEPAARPALQLAG